MGSPIPTVLLWPAVAAAVTLIWTGALALSIWASSPRSLPAAPPSQELGGTEPPAVAGLLTNGWRPLEWAAESTLIDLAARGYFEFRQPGNDPKQTTIHLRAKLGDEVLTAYERRVLNRVRALARDGVVPLTGLGFHSGEQARRWGRQLQAEVFADATARGLAQPRLSPLLQLLLAASSAGPALTWAVAVGVLTYGTGGVITSASSGLLIAMLGFLALTIVALTDRGERDTDSGRAAAARWLGLQAYLSSDRNFGRLPPAAVAVWDRYLAYGHALDTTPLCSALIDLGAGNRKRPWSSFGGTWHRMQIRYPGWWGWLGRSDGPIRQSLMQGGAATFALPVAGFVLGWVIILRLHDEAVRLAPRAYFAWADQGSALVAVGLMTISVFGHWLRLPRLWGRYGQTAPRLVIWSLVQIGAGGGMLIASRIPMSFALGRGLVEAAAVVALALILRGVYRLVRAAIDLAAPAVIEGEVIRIHVWRSYSRGMDNSRRPWLYYLVVDDGRGNRASAWALPRELRRECVSSDLVRLVARPWSRRITAIEVISSELALA
jgi:Predicted membrane protein (DUF2207)